MHKLLSSLSILALAAATDVAFAGGAEPPLDSAKPSAPPLAARTTGSQLTVTMHKIDDKGVGEEIGTLMFSITRKGLRIEAALGSLPPGEHGFHIHDKPSCEPAEKEGKMGAGNAAGSHFDPKATGKHLGPQGSGHRGDLPVLKVDANGNATETMFVLRLGLDDVKGHAIMIHEGGDNYSDEPKPLGGGGARIACGVVN